MLTAEGPVPSRLPHSTPVGSGVCQRITWAGPSPFALPALSALVVPHVR